MQRILMSCMCGIIVVLTAVLAGADYSSLTDEEYDKVVRAFEQAKYYKYYDALNLGRDTATILDIKRVGKQLREGNIIVDTYVITLELGVEDKKFKREVQITLETEVIPDLRSKSQKFWDAAWRYGLVAVGALVTGYIVGRIDR